MNKCQHGYKDMRSHFLSFDCANKSLAVMFFSFNLGYKDEIRDVLNSGVPKIKKLVNIHQILRNVVEIFYLDVIDICPNVKINDLNIIERSHLFKSALCKVNELVQNIKVEHNIDLINVYIERQPTFNIKSTTIFSQLIYEYANDDLFNIKIMYPMLKNQIFLSDDLRHSVFISNSNNGYRANKNHSKANFLYFIEKFNLKNRITHIKKKNLDDIADAFLQVLTDIKYLI